VRAQGTRAYKGNRSPPTHRQDIKWSIPHNPIIRNVTNPVEHEIFEQHIHNKQLVRALPVGIESVRNRRDASDEDTGHHNSLEQSADVCGRPDLDEMAVPEHADAAEYGGYRHVAEAKFWFTKTLVSPSDEKMESVVTAHPGMDSERVGERY
jgi:hypothetical protein